MELTTAQRERGGFLIFPHLFTSAKIAELRREVVRSLSSVRGKCSASRPEASNLTCRRRTAGTSTARAMREPMGRFSASTEA